MIISISGVHIDGIGSNIESNSRLNLSIGNPNALSHGAIVFGAADSTFIGLSPDMTCLPSGRAGSLPISACMTIVEWMRWTPDRLATRSESGASGQHAYGAPVVARLVPAVNATVVFNLRMSGRWGIPATWGRFRSGVHHRPQHASRRMPAGTTTAPTSRRAGTYERGTRTNTGVPPTVRQRQRRRFGGEVAVYRQDELRIANCGLLIAACGIGDGRRLNQQSAFRNQQFPRPAAA